jgi:hypothetical protein
MRRFASVSISISVFQLLLLCLLTGCRSAAVSVLPTATPLATQAIPTFTATFLPPPTVTLYPTGTPRDGEAGPAQPGAPIQPPGPSEGPSNPVLAPQSTEIPTVSPTASPTSAPPPTPTVSFVNLPSGVSLGGQIYNSDFSAGWPSSNDPSAKIAIQDAQYRFEIGPFDGRFFNTTALNQADLYAQIDVTTDNCPQKAGYGLMFHFQNANNYYLVTIFCDSTYTAVAKASGSLVGLSNGKLPNGLDAAGDKVHHLGVLARGTDYTLYLDGQSIGSFIDAQFPKGDVAIYAVSQGSKVLKLAFDNLIVWSVS